MTNLQLNELIHQIETRYLPSYIFCFRFTTCEKRGEVAIEFGTESTTFPTRCHPSVTSSGRWEPTIRQLWWDILEWLEIDPSMVWPMPIISGISCIVDLIREFSLPSLNGANKILKNSAAQIILTTIKTNL